MGLSKEYEGYSYRELRELVALGVEIYEEGEATPTKVVLDEYGQVSYIPVLIEDIKKWREWRLEESQRNVCHPQDGTDCVTPFDKYLY